MPLDKAALLTHDQDEPQKPVTILVKALSGPSSLDSGLSFGPHAKAEDARVRDKMIAKINDIINFFISYRLRLQCFTC